VKAYVNSALLLPTGGLENLLHKGICVNIYASLVTHWCGTQYGNFVLTDFLKLNCQTVRDWYSHIKRVQLLTLDLTSAFNFTEHKLLITMLVAWKLHSWLLIATLIFLTLSLAKGWMLCC